MYTDGVKNVIFLFYPHLVDFGVIDYSIFNPAIDYTYTKLATITDPGLNYYFMVDPRSEFEGHSDYFITNDIHPNQTGANILSQMIWDNMQSNGIEQ